MRQLLDRHLAETGRDIRLQVDGGVKVENVRQIVAAGADTLVAGSAIFGQPDYLATIRRFRMELKLNECCA